MSKTAPIQAASLIVIGPYMDYFLNGRNILNYNYTLGAIVSSRKEWLWPSPYGMLLHLLSECFCCVNDSHLQLVLCSFLTCKLLALLQILSRRTCLHCYFCHKVMSELTFPPCDILCSFSYCCLAFLRYSATLVSICALEDFRQSPFRSVNLLGYWTSLHNEALTLPWLTLVSRKVLHVTGFLLAMVKTKIIK